MPLELRQIEMHRRRGMILYLLYLARPKSIDFGMLMYLLDSRNYPVTRHRLAEDLDFLRDAGFLRITTPSSELTLNEHQQERFLNRFAESDGDSDNDYAAKISPKGSNFQEGKTSEPGVLRVN